VILTDGKAGTVENVWLDELHGLRISIRGHDGEVAYLHHQVRAGGLKSILGCDALLGYDRDDPARMVARLNFHYRMDHPRDRHAI
jgi:hypothetical protein